MTIEPIDPERRLAAAYAPRQARAPLSVLFALDERLAQLAARTSEPAIAMMRLLWWRDALAALDDAPPPAEPLLQACATLRAHAIDGARLATLADAWGDCLDEPGEPGPEQARGTCLFTIAATLLGGADDERIAQAGAGWGLVEAGRHDSGGRGERLRRALSLLASAMERRWPRALRPLGMLAALALEEARRPSRLPPPPASPRRLLRIVRHQITGR